MKNLLVLIFLLTTFFSFSQNQGSLRGTVLDLEMQNEPLLFANVQLKEVDLKAETNFRGDFEFKALDKGKYTLIISYAGYEKIEMPITISASEVTQVNLGMTAKQISFDNIAGLEISSEDHEALPSMKEFPKK